MKDRQKKAREFVEEHDLEGTTGFRILDLVSEVGEIAKDATKSTDYGLEEDDLKVKKDEIGDVLFTIFVIASDLGIDAGEAFDKAIEKYERRIEETGDPESK